MTEEGLRPLYSSSRALIIGIDDYKFASPLAHAANDARALATVVQDIFGFPHENVKLLLNEQATGAAILDSFLSLTGEDVAPDDRVLVFFAGHGWTRRGRRGEIGYLIPCDGNVDNLATLIRWDQLTLNAELIAAKHLLFIMDACYGGLAITRSPAPGSMRFLKDMLLRYSRQVLTAGKADEVVCDSGGPIPDHSIFTGHLLEALSGKAADSNGIITANGIMPYVYVHVARDSASRQTPHFGYVDGDGDFIFAAPVLEELQKGEQEDSDKLISIPAVLQAEEVTMQATAADQAKEYLSEPRYRIRLHDLVAQQVRIALGLTSDDNFAVETHTSQQELVEEFRSRLKRYEGITRDLRQVSACVSYWGDNVHQEVLKMALSRLTDRLASKSGTVLWLALRWYPVMLISYSSGIAAVAAKRYDNLAAMFMTDVTSPDSYYARLPLVRALGHSMVELERTNAFKTLPGHERNYVPRSEYLLKVLQPDLDDLLFLGSSYESSFDRFELMLALVHADLGEKENKVFWGPIGRFAWKHRSDGRFDPLTLILQEASREKEAWAPLRARLFDGSYSRFEDIARRFQNLLSESSL